MPQHQSTHPSVCPGLAVLIPSVGRADELGETVKSIQGQSLRPAQIILSVPNETDLPDNARHLQEVIVCVGKVGKTAQLNRGLKSLYPEIEVVAVVDDDVELTEDYLKHVWAAFARDTELVGLSGRMIVNGGIDRAGAKDLVRRLRVDGGTHVFSQAPLAYLSPHQGLYGCCMSLRRSLFDHIQFDERLPLYSWMDDADIGIRAQKYGRCAYCAEASLVHLAIKTGKVSGTRFGFSQIMNPVYLASTGVFRWREVIKIHLLKVILANLIGWIRRDQKVDRWGRLHGNWIALSSWARGRIEPEIMTSIKK